MTENQGWIKLHRKFLGWEWYSVPEMVHLFLHLLLSANHEDGQWKGNEVKRGQLITGLKSLNKQTGISTQTLRTCLTRLKSTNEITNQSTNKYRLITIVKYEDYQQDERKLTSKSTIKLTNNQQTTNKQLTSNNNGNNEKNEKKKEVLSPTATEEPFSFNNQLRVMFADKDKRMPIIAYYWSIKGFVFDNRDKYSSALKRELKASGDLKGYTNEEIKRTCEWLKQNSDFKWTLETVLKYIDEPLDTMTGKGKLKTEDDFIKQLREQNNYGKS